MILAQSPNDFSSKSDARHYLVACVISPLGMTLAMIGAVILVRLPALQWLWAALLFVGIAVHFGSMIGWVIISRRIALSLGDHLTLRLWRLRLLSSEYRRRLSYGYPSSTRVRKAWYLTTGTKPSNGAVWSLLAWFYVLPFATIFLGVWYLLSLDAY